MKKLIRLDKGDIKKLIAKEFNVDVSQVTVSSDEITGLFDFKTTVVSATIDMTNEAEEED